MKRLLKPISGKKVQRVLAIKDLCVNYGHIKAVKGVTLEINQGEIVTLIGANGAGKSTIMNTITGLIKPSSGTITFMDERIDKLSPAEIVKKGVALAPEGRRIFPKLTVEDNLKMGAFTRKDKESVSEDIQKVYDYFPRLAERKKQMGGTLSGGEQQMLAIGRAIMTNPKILFLDEPSLGLAPLLVEIIFEIIKAIHAAGTTVFLVEQKAYLALKLAERGYVLENGLLALSGTTQQLMQNEHVKNAYLG